MLTCLSCRVSFSTNLNQKEHYKSPWHHYNTSRKIVGLEPITFELFQKIQEKREEELSKQKDDLAYICNVCRKSFSSNNVLIQHLQSKKHKLELEKKSVSPNQEDITSVKSKAQINSEALQNRVTLDNITDEDEWEDLNAESLNICECLFCPIIKESVDSLIKHLGIEHSFFINDIQYCTDIEGLLRYLGECIKIRLSCIRCSSMKSSYNSLEAVQKHMISKSHCRMKTELGDILEYSDFYDYSQTYPDDEDDFDKDEEFEANVLNADDNWQLVLPSGAIIGHRSLRIYYKQKLPAVREKVTKTDNKNRVCKIMTDYKALGWQEESSKALAFKKARDIKYFYKLRQSRDFISTNKVKNKASQPHYRSQN